MEYRQPPFESNYEGEARRVGVELEYGAVDAAASAEMVQHLFGGTLEKRDPHKYKILDTSIGDFVCELDAHYIHPENIPFDRLPKSAQGFSEWLAPFHERLSDVLGDIAAVLMPYEIVCPPVEIRQLEEIDGIVHALRAAQARDTTSSIFYSFGLQLNPDIAATDVDYIHRMLQAYILLSDWLRETTYIDITRQLMPYARPFPRKYARLVLDDDYAPDMDRLMDDYLHHNPTRNRELDLMPLFAWIDETRVQDVAKDPLVKPRPTFHYRLPDARVRDENWSIAHDWNLWVRVEELAADGARLRDMADVWRRYRPNSFGRSFASEAEKWL